MVVHHPPAQAYMGFWPQLSAALTYVMPLD